MIFLNPSLFDRLSGEPPKQGQDAERELERNIRRDLEVLFNTRSLESMQSNIGSYDEVKNSVVNYGITDYSGLLRNELNIHAAIKLIERAILDYEPRIIPKTLEIIPDALLQGQEKNFSDLPVETKNKLFEKGAFEFTIRGQICADLRPITFECNTNMSFLTGNISID